jgi:hypothetical protein
MFLDREEEQTLFRCVQGLYLAHAEENTMHVMNCCTFLFGCLSRCLHLLEK